MHYFMARKTGEFAELRTVEFGDDDITQLQLLAVTGGSPAGVDGVWTDVDIRADSIQKIANPARGGTRTPNPRKSRRPVIGGVAAAAAALLASAGGGAWIWRRRRRRANVGMK
jgi:hypothetical protein